MADNDDKTTSGGTIKMGIQSSFRYAPSKSALAVILVLLNGFAAETVLAASQEGDTKASIFDSKYIVALGGYFPRTQSELTITGPGGGNALGGDRLGLEQDASSVWGSFNWRFLPRHQLHLEYFQINREGSRSGGATNIGGTDIGVGALLNSEFDLGLGRFTYGYSIIKKSNWNLVFNAGFHIVTTKATITASGNLSQGGLPLIQKSKTFSTSTWTFPLPHIGGSFAYKFGPKVTLALTGLIFAIDIGQYSGSLIEVDAMATYQITKHFGVGGGAKYYDLNLKDDPSGPSSVEYDMSFIGPAFFVYGNF